jgi:hypothetical protein
MYIQLTQQFKFEPFASPRPKAYNPFLVDSPSKRNIHANNNVHPTNKVSTSPKTEINPETML